MEKKKYNLHSARTETVQIPIQVQVSDDSEFLNLLGNTPVAQPDSDASSNSDSDLDLSAVLAGSDSDDVSTQGRSFDRLQSEIPSTSAAVPDQALVNQQILAQLSVIDTRLHKLEQEKSVKNQNIQKLQAGVHRANLKVLLSKAHIHMVTLPEP